MSSLLEKLNTILTKHQDLGQKLMDPAKLGDDFAKFSKEYSDLEEVVESINQFKKSSSELEDAKKMLSDSSIDKDMKDMLACKHLRVTFIELTTATTDQASIVEEMNKKQQYESLSNFYSSVLKQTEVEAKVDYVRLQQANCNMNDSSVDTGIVSPSNGDSWLEHLQGVAVKNIEYLI